MHTGNRHLSSIYIQNHSGIWTLIDCKNNIELEKYIINENATTIDPFSACSEYTNWKL